jgi:phosphoserine aminotransferase
MIRSLSFKADPPPTFHTYHYHSKKAIKEGYIDNQIDPVVKSEIIRQTLTGLMELFEIPENYHLVLLQENRLMVEMLASLAMGRIVVAGSSVFTDRYSQYADEFINPDVLNEELSTKGSEISMQKDLRGEKTGKLPREDIRGEKTGELPRKDLSKEKTGKLPREDLSSMNNGDMSLILQDIDPLTGRKLHPDSLKKSQVHNALSFSHLDISYSSPTDPLDYENFQSFSFETKYGFGMDQDLVVWIMKDDLFDVFTEKFSGIYMEFDTGFPKSKKCIIQYEIQIHRIYILGKIIQDFLNRGLTIIRNEIKYKSIILYNSISDNPNLDPLIKDHYWQSQNILCASTELPGEKLFDFMSGNRIEFDLFTSSDLNSIIRVANYPVHSKEQVEFLVDLIEKL